MTENKDLHEPIELILYLYTRLTQLGITTIHGSLFAFSNNLVQATDKANLNYVRSSNEAHAGLSRVHNKYNAMALTMETSIRSRWLRTRQRHLSPSKHLRPQRHGHKPDPFARACRESPHHPHSRLSHSGP